MAEGVSGTRADYRPEGAETNTGKLATLKRTAKEFSEDNLLDWAGALTYYGVLALFPAIIALTSIVGLFTDAAALTNAAAEILPRDAAETIRPALEDITSNQTAGIGLIIGLLGAIWSASGYVGAFTRAANVVYETPEGRKAWKLKPLQLLVTLTGVILAAIILAAVVLSGDIARAVGDALGVGDTLVLVWNIAKWPVIALLVTLMIAILYYSTPNVKLRGFRYVSPGAAVAVLTWIIASALFALYVAQFSSYNATYGTMAGVIVFLVWFWITNIAVLFGIQLDAELERSKELREGIPRAEKEIQLDARAEPKKQQTT